MKTKTFKRLFLMLVMLVTTATGAKADGYITEVMTIGYKIWNGGDVRNSYKNQGWTIIDRDIDKNNSWYVYIAYKTSSTADPEKGYVTDICVTNIKQDTLHVDGRIYHRTQTNGDFDGNIYEGDNLTKKGYLYYTTDRANLKDNGGSKRVITGISDVVRYGSVGESKEDLIRWLSYSTWSYYDNYYYQQRYLRLYYFDTEWNWNSDYRSFFQMQFTTQTVQWMEEPVFASNLTFNGKPQHLVTKNPYKENYGTLEYRVNGGNWSSAVPTATKVGDYKVEARLNGGSYADNSSIVSKTVTINPPVVKATNFSGVFSQADKKVYLSWDGTAPHGYTDYKWVVYRDGVKLGVVNQNVRSYADTGYTNEAKHGYTVYYVSNYWGEDTKRDDCKATVTMDCKRTVPVNNLVVERLEDRIALMWTSDGYKKGFGHKFLIYMNDETVPVDTIVPSDMQTNFRWEHRTTNEHTNRISGRDEETGIFYTEEMLNFCEPNNYNIRGVIDDKVFKREDVYSVAIGEGTQFYDFLASKGVYEDCVKLSWHIDQRGLTLMKTYIIERRRAEQDQEAWETLTRLTSTDEYLFYTDDTALSGVFYDYRVTVLDRCEDGKTAYSMASSTGFSKSTGTVTGRIAYGTSGVAVKGVDVKMTIANADDDDNSGQFHSLYFDDSKGAVTWEYPSKTYIHDKLSGSNFTTQMWMKPHEFADTDIMNFGNSVKLSMTSEGKLTFTEGRAMQPHQFEGVTLGKNFNHVAFIREADLLKLVVVTLDSINNPVLQKASVKLGRSLKLTDLKGAAQFEMGHFKGAIDEFRLWTKALTEDDVLENYNHLLVGDEKDLETYWTFDEGLSRQAFDYSREGTNHHSHHGKVTSNAQSSTVTPAVLALRAKTDKDGNYVIPGIPFSGGGTTYSVTPSYGIHKFNPNKSVAFISGKSLVHSKTDFEDVSSFPMEGYVYYAGTNIPVEGMQFKIDGELVTGNGELKQTNSNGYYSISVPIGKHYVEATLSGHTMVAGGRFPTEGTFDFDRAVTYDFADSTLVNFVGRVAGGERNDTLAVGFAKSDNNIGVATITLALGNDSFSFNCKDDHITTAASDRPWESDTTAIRSHSWTGTGDFEKYIYIRTDSVTGEFSALLPPLKYKTKSIRVNNNDEIAFVSQPEIDLSSVTKELADSVLQKTAKGDSVWVKYNYNTKKVWTYFAEPHVELWQVGGNGAFGEKEMKNYAMSSVEKVDITDIWTREDGAVKYTYGFPVFARKEKYTFGVRGYEVYVNKDEDEPVRDTIPLKGLVLTVANEMSDQQAVVALVTDSTLTDLKAGDIYDLKYNQVRLDDKGTNEIVFTTGAPNVTAPYTRQFSIEFERNGRTYAGPKVNGVVLGELTNGNNFVTEGPDHVDMVLRDPPGAKSRTIWKTGKSWTEIDYKTRGFYGNEGILYDVVFGTELKLATGVGVALLSASTLKNTTVAGVTAKYQYTKIDEKTYVYTEATNIGTSTGSKYVGANGDLFIGKSHNWIIGTCRKLGFYREEGGIVLDLREAVSINDSIKTDFVYSALEIKETMIPKLIATRNALLVPVTDSLTARKTTISVEEQYLTWLNRDDPRYGQEGTYVWLPRAVGQSQDLVQHYNQSIAQWKARLSDNEEDKIEAAKNHDYYKENRSFDGGAAYTYSERRDTTITSKEQHTGSVGAVFENKFTVDVSGGAKFGITSTIKTENGFQGSQVKGDSAENVKSYQEFDYELNDGNTGTDFTIDIMRSPRGWSDVFLLRGGQSYNPYEGIEYAEYYEPKEKHVISYGTERMEQPDIRISTDGGISAKSAMLTDVPAGGTGQFTLHLTNNTTTNQDVPFAYLVKVKESSNQKGLEIYMDGVPASGVRVPIPAGETVKKVITVRQTDQSVLDYEDIVIMFASPYQPIEIFDKCKLSVHFKPSSSPVDLVVTESVFNNETFAANDSCLVMKLTNFDRQFTNLKNVGVQYRFEGSTAWTDLHTWVTDRADSTSTSFSMLPATGDLRLKLNMGSDLSYPEGQYEFRAFTTTPYGTELVHVYSDVVTVVKDLTRPRQLTTPMPTNGILGYGDDIMVEFNEDIVPGYVTDKNVIVTAKLNSQQVVHDVAKQLGGEGEQRTVNPVYMNGDFTLEFWMKWSDPGTILRNGRDRFVLGVTDDGHFEVNIGTAQFISRDVLPKDEWTYVAVNYKEADMTMSALAQSGTSNLTLFKKAPVDSMAIASISYSDDNYIYLGNMKGAIHDLTIYNICRDLVDAAATKYQTKNGYVYGMTNHWAMDEGHGTVAADTRNTHDFIVNQQWLINNVNCALGLEHVQDGSTVEANITSANTFTEDSYAIELWHMGKASGSGTESVFETNSNEAKRLKLYYDEDKNMVLAYGLKKQTVATTDVAPYGDWHHLALNVVRGQSAVFYVDGRRTAVIAESDMPALTGSRMKLGEHSTGNIDELRIWRATLSEKRLLQNMYNTLDTADIYSRGLVAYYPFEKDSVVYGVQTKVFTLKDMAPGNSGNDILAKTVAGQTEPKASVAPPLKNAIAESRLTATPTASDRKVVIRLRNTSGVTASELEGCQLNITLDKVHDMHGNQSEPIRWTAYVRKNTLVWMKDSVTIIKPYGEDYFFDVDIKNLGGNTEYYSLSNMRSWLEVVDAIDGMPVETEGTVAPESQKTLRFWVKPLVAVGNYDITVGLQGNQEIMEPLRIVMKVRGQAPDWAVDPNKYENSMSIVGQVYVNGVLMSNSESRLAAFIDNECRGVAEIRSMRGAAYVAMTIYGTAQQNKNGVMTDLDNGQPISFRIWDASKGMVYANVNTTMDGSSVNITFDDSKTYGNFNSPVIFAKSNLMEQELKLKSGWNWISLGVEPKETKTDMVFKELTPWNVHIKDRSTGIHYCNGTYWDGTLDSIHANVMYKMEIKDSPKSRNMEMPSLLPVTGESVKAAETKVTLKKGWNWIAYIPTVSMTLDRSLAGANPQEGDQVKSQQGFAFYGPYGWEGNLDAMESGKGYLYYSVDETTKAFVYPAAPVASNKARAVETNRAPELTMFTPVNPENYPDNMSMVVKLVDGEETVSDAELGAFIDGECRGAATATNGLYYLLIAGEGYGKPMELQVAINSNVIPLVTDITFSSDANIGTPWEPYVIDLSNVLSGINEITVDDNDDDDWWTLQGFKIGRKPTQPGVYIHHGQKVTIKRAK